MQTIQWRPEVNAMTTPQSWRILAVPRRSAGIEDIAADIALQHPNFSKADILTILRAEDKAVQARLLNGEQVTKEGSWSWFVSFSGRLNHPNDPLPPIDQCLNVNVRISPPFTRAIRQSARTERLPARLKQPLISTARDPLLGLNNVLNPTVCSSLGAAISPLTRSSPAASASSRARRAAAQSRPALPRSRTAASCSCRTSLPRASRGTTSTRFQSAPATASTARCAPAPADRCCAARSP